MPKQVIQFGTGLQRAAGYLAAPPEAMRDLRNVHTRLGRVLFRKGHTAKAEISASDHILGIFASRPDQAGIVVVQEQTSGDIEVWRTDTVGDNEEYLDDWFTLQGNAYDPPRIIGAPAYQKVFLAHDEPLLQVRAPTYYYDPSASDYLTELQLDLDGNGDAAVYFRGVCFWKDHLIGWGYGRPDDPHPEWIWASLPGEPTNFDPEHYAPVGAIGDPVLRVVPGPQPIIFKASSTYILTGRYALEFLVQQTDPLFGLAGSRLAVLVDNKVYGWSLNGPRVWGPNGQSSGLDIPLDLDAPDPSGLVAEGAAEEAWAEYDHEEKLVIFTFGRRQYKLSLWNPQQPEWSYGELPLEATSAGILYDTGNNTAPAGEPQHNADELVGSTLTVTVDHVNALGDEYLEIWLTTDDGSTWTMEYSGPVNGQSQEEVVIELGSPPPELRGAMRYRRGSQYNSGSTNADPDLWDADGIFEQLEPPTLDSLAWSRTGASAEKVAVQFTPVYSAHDVEIWRKDGVAGTYALLTTVTAATHGGSQYTYDDTTATGNATNSSGANLPDAEGFGLDETQGYYFKVRTKKDGSTFSDFSSELEQYPGPEQPPSNLSATAGAAGEIDLAWTDSGNGRNLDIWASINGGNWNNVHSTSSALGSWTHTGLSGGDVVDYYVREKETVSGTEDFTIWSNTDQATAT